MWARSSLLIRRLDPLDVVGGGERLDLADRPAADGQRRREVGEDLLDLEAA